MQQQWPVEGFLAMSPDEPPTLAEIGRGMKAMDRRMEAGFADLRAEITEVRNDVRTSGYVRADVYTERQERIHERLLAVERTNERSTTALSKSVEKNWALTWALILVILGVLAKTFG